MSMCHWKNNCQWVKQCGALSLNDNRSLCRHEVTKKVYAVRSTVLRRYNFYFSGSIPKPSAVPVNCLTSQEPTAIYLG